MRNKWKKRPFGFRQVLYYGAILILIVTSIYQVSLIRENLSDIEDVVEKGETGAASSLLTPHAAYLTAGENQGFVKIEATSGYYPQVCRLSRKMIEHVVSKGYDVQNLVKGELPDTAPLMVLQYAYVLEHTALKELLSLSMKDSYGFQELWIQPAVTMSDAVSVYLINWEEDVFLQLISEVSQKDAVNSGFCEMVYEITDTGEDLYRAGWKQYPESMQGVYYRKEESSQVLYDVQLVPSYYDQDGFRMEEAEEYVRHFFPYPDAVRSIGNDEEIVWYADEKRTVRLEKDGFLQCVQTPEQSDTTKVSLEDAYEMAASFLEEDLNADENRFTDVYLCEYVIEDATYTFYWNYKLNNIPLNMNPERQQQWELPYPIRVVVEEGMVRYYHRYLVNPEVRTNSMKELAVSYMEVLDQCYEEGMIHSMQLCYMEGNKDTSEENASNLQLCWQLIIDGKMYTQAVGGDGV